LADVGLKPDQQGFAMRVDLLLEVALVQSADYADERRFSVACERLSYHPEGVSSIQSWSLFYLR
jgi:hypothetical protein